MGDSVYITTVGEPSVHPVSTSSETLTGWGTGSIRLDAANRVIVTELGAAAEGGSSDDRTAILETLYADRSELIEQEFLGDLSGDDAAQLRRLEKEIARWQRREVASPNAEVLSRLEAIVAKTLDIQARINRAGAKGK